MQIKFKDLIPPLMPEEYNALQESIIKEGCRDPIIIWGDILIDGHNRYEICKENKIKFETREKKFENEDEAKIWIIDNQFSRRNLSAYDRSVLALRKEELLKKKGKENIVRGAKGLQISVKANTQKELSKIAGVSHDTIFKVKTIEDKAPKEVKDKIRKGETTINKAYKAITQKEKRENKAKDFISNHLPEGEFDVIYGDPPWKYDFSNTSNREIENQYPTMELEEIKTLKIPSAENSVLFLWATAPKIREALEVIEAWGFEYKSHLIWNKQIIGLGYWFRGQHELLLVATKGKFSPPEPEKLISSVYSEKRTKHSKKPDYFYTLIESYFPNGKYLELFARKKINDKWEVWGNEV